MQPAPEGAEKAGRRVMGMDFRMEKSDRVNWRDIMLAGGAASVLNSLGTKIFFDNDIRTASARFLGDVTGMLVSIFLLMLIFRVLRLANGGRRI